MTRTLYVSVVFGWFCGLYIGEGTFLIALFDEHGIYVAGMGYCSVQGYV